MPVLLEAADASPSAAADDCLSSVGAAADTVLQLVRAAQAEQHSGACAHVCTAGHALTRPLSLLLGFVNVENNVNTCWNFCWKMNVVKRGVYGPVVSPKAATRTSRDGPAAVLFLACGALPTPQNLPQPHPDTIIVTVDSIDSDKQGKGRLSPALISKHPPKKPMAATTTTDHIRNRVLAGHAAVEAASSPSSSALAARLLPNANRLLPLSVVQQLEERQATATAAAPSVDAAAACIDPPGKIRSTLFIGSRETEACLAALQAAGITHVLQAGGELRPSHPDRLVYCHLSVSDEEDEDLVAAFRQAFEFIDEGRKRGGCSCGVVRGVVCGGVWVHVQATAF